MCGIVGILNLEQDNNVSIETLRSMTNSIIRRGPDDEGFYCNQNIGLGFRRLSIIDLATGHQPLSNEDDSIWIIFNGEIYNYQELRYFLQNKGHKFKTHTDTEVIIHLYEELGDDCVKHLRGMFAFAIWNNSTKKLFCARDRFGIKPFYYYIDNSKLVFASEIKAILKSGNIDKSLSLEAIDSYFAYGHMTSNLSIYQHIKKLNPGTSLTLSLSPLPKLELKTYWEIHFEPDHSKTEAQWMDEIESSLSDAVKLHMVSDVPLGAFLSGGIDSSSIVALMSQHSTSPIKTFSIGFKEKPYNELKYAEAIAKKYNTEHYFQIVEPESIHLLSTLVSSFDEPFADTSAIPTYIVSKFASQFVSVVLSGDGGDELFAGYNHYPQLAFLRKLNFNNRAINNLFWGTINKILPASFRGKNLTYYLSKDKETVGAYYGLFNQSERNFLINREILNTINKNRAESFKEHLILSSTSNDYITRLQNLDIKTYMVDEILTKVDRVSMHNSLEVRVPILDHQFAELTFKIPSSLKLKNGTQKYIFKEAMKNKLPDCVINHKKQGFNIPLEHWFRSELKDYINSRINDRNCLLSEYINIKHVKQTINNHNKGFRNLSERIWAILVFDEWLKQNSSNN
ncbi:MAG: asparagine synthase (glutamine-hydrolyzing) [Bacteroidota bacterium]|nr:asparagine synthase (glutamine-hydrolyzing) [Bacteroidota bacterium]